MLDRIRNLVLLVFFVVFLSACGQGGEVAAPPMHTAAPAQTLEVYQTSTPEQSSSSGGDAESSTPTLPPLPTPTPFLYTVVQNDTLIGIANRFGVTLDALRAANPQVEPYALSVGTQLVIPLGEDEQGEGGSAALPPPVDLQTGSVSCYSARSGGLWCYWLISNPSEQTIENISGLIRLYDGEENEVAAQTVSALVNTLPGGAQMPLAAYFPPPVPAWQQAQGQLVSALEANLYAQRYFVLYAQDVNVTGLGGGLTEGQGALVTGKVNLQGEASYLWLLVTAYDQDEEVVGTRRWAAPEGPLTGEIPFSVEMYTMGKPIVRVEILAEARKTGP